MLFTNVITNGEFNDIIGTNDIEQLWYNMYKPEGLLVNSEFIKHRCGNISLNPVLDPQIFLFQDWS